MPEARTLKERAAEYAEKHSFRIPYDGTKTFYDEKDYKSSEEGYIAGAKKEKELIIKEAIKYISKNWQSKTVTPAMIQELKKIIKRQ